MYGPRSRLIDKAAALIARGPEARKRRAKANTLAAAARAERKRINRRKPPEAGIAIPAVPPGGPLPIQGGAEAPLDFD